MHGFFQQHRFPLLFILIGGMHVMVLYMYMCIHTYVCDQEILGCEGKVSENDM